MSTVSPTLACIALSPVSEPTLPSKTTWVGISAAHHVGACRHRSRRGCRRSCSCRPRRAARRSRSRRHRRSCRSVSGLPLPSFRPSRGSTMMAPFMPETTCHGIMPRRRAVIDEDAGAGRLEAQRHLLAGIDQRQPAAAERAGRGVEVDVVRHLVAGGVDQRELDVVALVHDHQRAGQPAVVGHGPHLGAVVVDRRSASRRRAW